MTCWLTLFDAGGAVLAEWSEAFGPEAAAITVDSREVRRRFGLGEFAGRIESWSYRPLDDTARAGAALRELALARIAERQSRAQAV